jgi:hypothetical protein
MSQRYLTVSEEGVVLNQPSCIRKFMSVAARVAANVLTLAALGCMR